VNAEELNRAWASLATPDLVQQLSAAPVDPEGAYVAIDHEGHRHFLLRVPDGTDTPPTTTRGLRVSVAQHQVRGELPADYLDLVCLSDELAPTFTAVVADIGAESIAVTPDVRVNLVLAGLERWQWFWGIEADRLSDTDALGLFGELWFLHRWEGGGREAVNAWTASTGSRHDFQRPERSVEVKTTGRRSDGMVTHRIQHLDQLADPELGSLYLFSLRVVRDELAHNTLPDLVDRVTESLEGDVSAKDDFGRKLAERGFNPAYRTRHSVPYRILGEHMYAVTPEFPRLTQDSFSLGLPAGVGHISYVLDMAVCDQWLVATNPDDWGPQ
jgi:hypothetical protein